MMNSSYIARGKNELSIINGLYYGGTWVIIPLAGRYVIIELPYEGHPGIWLEVKCGGQVWTDNWKRR